MVTQKEVLEAKRAELKDMKTKYAVEKAAFEATFEPELQAIESLRAEEDRLDNLMRRNTRMVANKVSDSPQLYARGNSHDLTQQMKDVLAQRFKILDHDASGVVWHAFHDVRDKVNADLETKAQGTRLQRYNIEQAEPFMSRQETVVKLKDSVHWLATHIEHLSDLSNFRQWAKHQKELDATNVIRKQKEDAQKELVAWLATEVFKLDDLMAKAYKAE